MAQSTYAGTAGDAGTGAQRTSPKPLIESDRVEGTAVYGSDNSHIGTIKRLMIDKVSGQVAYAVMSFGGFAGLGEETYTIPWSKLDYETDLGGYKTDIAPDSLKAAPAFSHDEERDWSDREPERRLHQYYGVSPYWGL
jgi:hypothetical protein